MHAVRTCCAGAAAAVLAGCFTSQAGVDAPAGSPRVSWATYQHSPDRNAVFRGYAIPRDWAYDAKTKVNSGLALAGNTLLFTTFSHRLVALDVRSGRRLWSAQVKNVAMSTPIVAGNSVYIGTGKAGILKRNLLQRIRFFRKQVWGVPGGDEVAAFDVRTGARIWSHTTVGEDMPSAVYDHGRLIFANGDWHAYALRADTGAQLWSTDIGGASTMASAVMAGTAVIVGICGTHSDTSTVALDPATGKILWRSSYGHCDASPAYADGKVFVNDVLPGNMTLRKKTLVAALDARTGKSVWAFNGTVQGLWSIVGSDEVAVAGAYASGTYYQPAPLLDQIIAFDANSGKIRWRFHTAGPVKMSPVVFDGRLYAGDVAGMLYTLDARTGALLEVREFKEPFTTSPPIVAGNRLLIANGTSVDAIPLSGRPNIPERVGWGIIATGESR